MIQLALGQSIPVYEAVVSIISQYTIDSEIQMWACATTDKLASDSDDHKVELCEAGAFEAIRRALLCHADDYSVVLWACRAAVSLPFNEDTYKKLTSAGASTAIAAAVLRYINSADIVLQGCRAASKRCIRYGSACTAVVAGMLQHIDLAEVCQRGCTAVTEMCSSDNRALTDAGACYAVVIVLVRHIDSALVCRLACTAIATLNNYGGTGCAQLRAANVFEAVVAAIGKHSDDQETAIVACDALYAVCCYYTSDAYKAKLLSLRQHPVYTRLQTIEQREKAKPSREYFRRSNIASIVYQLQA